MISRQSRVPLLVLAALAACKREDTPVTDPLTIPSATASSPATSATPSVTPTSTAIASATATPSATSSSGRALRECKVDQDCGAAYQECVKASPQDAIGHCDYRKNYRLGRPLVVDGEAHVAPYARAPLASAIDTLSNDARAEHASVAAFARTISELMALGAPTWLLFETQAALADEIRHTDMTLDLLERMTGERPALGRLEAAVAPLRSGNDAAQELFRDVFRGGAVGETLAAAQAERRGEAAQDDDLRAFYETIVGDESRHAALAFTTLRWLLGNKAELSRVLEEEKARFWAQEPIETRTLVGPLLDVLS